MVLKGILFVLRRRHQYVSSIYLRLYLLLLQVFPNRPVSEVFRDLPEQVDIKDAQEDRTLANTAETCFHGIV